MSSNRKESVYVDDSGFKVAVIAARDLRVGDRIVNTRAVPSTIGKPVTKVSLSGSTLSYTVDGQDYSGDIKPKSVYIISKADA